MRILLIFIVFAALLPVAAAQQVTNPDLRDELLSMLKLDQDERNKCTIGDAEAQGRCLGKLAETIDAEHTKRLEEIFDKHGLPDTKMVGKDGLNAFMIMLQHAPNDVLRERAVSSITRAFKRKELSPMDYANYIDRLRLHQGKRQLYGTGFETKDGKFVLSPTEDIKNLDKRCKKLGLPPMEEYVSKMREMYKLEVIMPEIGRR